MAAAHRLAGTALLTCEPGSREIVRLDERLPAALLVSRPELSTRLLAEVFGPLLTLVPAERSLLVETLEAWLECGGSVARAAARLGCHRNTVFNRLRRLERLTARSLSRPRELVDLVLALDVLRLSSAPAGPGGGGEGEARASSPSGTYRRQPARKSRAIDSAARSSSGPASAMDTAGSGSSSARA
nr:helix-turn-helix domain-containing protein [Streptomyces sp. MW-W600-10]